MPQTTVKREMLTTQEAAAVLGIRPQTLHLWRSAGREPQPPYIKIGGRLVRYRRRDLEAYLDHQTVGNVDAE